MWSIKPVELAIADNNQKIRVFFERNFAILSLLLSAT